MVKPNKVCRRIHPIHNLKQLIILLNKVISEVEDWFLNLGEFKCGSGAKESGDLLAFSHVFSQHFYIITNLGAAS